MKKPKTFKERLSTGPHYVVLRRTADGELLGWTENSISMSWSKEKVRVWTRDSFDGTIIGFPDITKYFSFLKKECFYKADKTLAQWCRHKDAFIARVGSKKCPIHIDTNQSDEAKYDYRNKSFSEKDKSDAEEVTIKRLIQYVPVNVK